ncbi:DnaJ domain-containing protein [Methylotenera sp.]|uniref:DnaJ domain-containing protein n=1 Tax=Methylotenera sp. TaxID=2051956 RepID=UPI002726B901|nr:DnaJ domain-containing protein [Methylotenera sp.]MDO9204420.1 DnaJ domain-containing protein [Methylotenera sp.]MDO9394045.1 DnaJ domain-containing protein [Methylotenera sp.]MDP1521975.1 DnaJ domain-containing protein [Methylotenera sp.]MDP2072195.1 DnaJ domain-containing protein [Methylotenera sp.]MDP2230958.1 DnaJ domain-containing protein [Methylotenera sp.]
MKDYYAVLGIAANASLAEIKTTYRKLASQFHPDKNSATDAPAKFRQVQEAYEVLSDVDKRKTYDENRRRSLLDSPIDTAHEIWQTYIDGILKR